jgi:TolA-binding protein
VSRTVSQMGLFARAWSKAAERAEPRLELDRSRERLLEAQRRLTGARQRFGRRWAMAAAAVALLVIGGVVGLHSDWLGVQLTPEPGAWLETQPQEQLPLEFSEGSRVQIEGRSRVRVASVDLRGARMVLERGSVSARIVHRADTKWAFEAGPFLVRVTGTELRVVWDPDAESFEVSVQSGSVVVSGPLLEGGRTLGSGERCAVSLHESRLEVSRSAQTESPTPRYQLSDLPVLPASAEPKSSSEAVAGHADATSWQALERQGKYALALEAAERVGLSSIYDGGTAQDLMTLARAARHAGRADVAGQALSRCRQRFAGSPRAATAAFLLGRSAGPAQAAVWFSTYLQEQPSGPLAREAAGRLIESYQRGGNQAAAREAADRYLRSYPSGPHAAYARRVVSDPGE